MEEFEGYVERILFRNEENGYTVLELETDDELVCVGTFPFISEGEYVVVKGTMIEHPQYGEQLKVTHYETKEPGDLIAMERYLSSGAIKGVREATAKKIVQKFGKETFSIIEHEPEKLTQIKGISDRIAHEIASQFEELKEMRGAMLFLQEYGISNTLSMKIYNYYKEELYEVIKRNPYQLAEDIDGVGFKIADEIGRKAGISADSDFRIRAGILYVLTLINATGHVYYPEQELISECVRLIGEFPNKISYAIDEMVYDKTIIRRDEDDERKIYTSRLYYAELQCARMLHDLNIKSKIKEEKICRDIEDVEIKENISLDDLQRKAVLEAVTNGVLVITGGPGTGKTTTINTIIGVLEAQGLDLLLAAPTGRAAKRMSEATTREARTIHRLLEFSGGVDDEDSGMHFERNEWNPLETDVIIIDEMSMVDIQLFYYLLKAVVVGTRLILVGDVNQLPSVGPGNVLLDIIQSECFPVVKLDKIFRQAAESDIIVNAHKINRGESISLNNDSKDFFCMERADTRNVLGVMTKLVKENMPKYVDAQPFDIQVLCPMKKGELGTYNCNRVLQHHLNPPDPNKPEIELHGILFRKGDKVMQIKNNYQIEWEILGYNGIVIEEGKGVFNGDCGMIVDIDLFEKEIVVEFEESKIIHYPFGSADELVLAYAITIHKSQGSEYPAVVMPLLSVPQMLANRNLLYTAVTRARLCVTIVGSGKMVQHMINNESEQKRYTSLNKRIQEILNS